MLLLAHGSKDSDYGAACASFLDAWNRCSGTHAQLCFLEQCEPLLEDALNRVATYSHSVAVFPLLLNAGMHLQQDIPDRIAQFKQGHPEMDIQLADGLMDTDAIAETLHSRAMEVQMDKPAFILLTHGSRQSGVQKHIMQLATALAERVEAGVSVAFLGHGGLSLEDVFAEQVGDHVVIVPHFLFPGGWIKQVQAEMEELRHAHPKVELILAKPLCAHPCILRLLQQRLNSVT